MPEESKHIPEESRLRKEVAAELEVWLSTSPTPTEKSIHIGGQDYSPQEVLEGIRERSDLGIQAIDLYELDQLLI